MLPSPRQIALAEHQRWLDYLQPEGLVVSPLALVDSQVQLDTGVYAKTQDQFLDALTPDLATGEAVVADFARFARNFLGWRDELLSIFSVTAEIPDGLRVSTGEHGEILQPDAAYRAFQPADPARPWLVLVRQLPVGTEPDQLPDAKQERGWVATPHQKFERLLRETGVPIGVLCTGRLIRLVYAPKGENSGWLTFPVGFMTQIAGRAVASALELLLSNRRLVGVPEPVRLPALLRKSRDYQAEVSTALSNQVLEALYELARGFQAADERAKGTLLADAWQRDPQEIYGGLITTLLRLVFLLYAEDRGLMPAGDLYQRGYSVQGLFQQLRADHERHPDTMDDRYGGWPRLLALFRAVYGGCKHRKMTLPARQGHLFDPNRFPFLEGRADSRQPAGESLPRLSDGTLHRVLHLLLYLDGERLSYRTLDVEQIGSVYETIMGFAVEKAPGRMIALKPKKKHGAPVHLSLDALLAAKPAAREKLLAEQADTQLPAAAAKALKEAATLDDLLAALEKRIDRRATPHPVPVGSILLQPTDERRRSGSHYTPRSFTEPIVRKTLEPILDRLGRHPRPETLLELKIADIAVGSAAFLVETCRQLADELVASWHFHKCLPVIPPDEDELLYARRLVAQRCLYGVDRNPMAVDLAKLSLWLATMARDHPFTFLDHAIKCGDSLVGLTNRQIAAFHWDLETSRERVLGQERLEQQIAKVAALRKEILAEPDDTEFAILRKQAKLAEADAAARQIKTAGDLVIAAFFAGDKPKKRQDLRDDYLERYLTLQRQQNVAENLKWQVRTLDGLRSGSPDPVGSETEQGLIGDEESEDTEGSSSSSPKTENFNRTNSHPIRPFHWEIEFPEVFSRENPGFDGFVGNPPFAGKNTITSGNAAYYPDWLQECHKERHGNADLVAYFFRQAFTLLRSSGTFGLIATNTICQGDTRSTGLRWICLSGGEIYEARKRVKWPGEAAVIVSTACIFKGPFAGQRQLDRRPVSTITAYFFHQGGHNDPEKLRANADQSFAGATPYGRGFTFDDTDNSGLASTLADMRRLLENNPNNQAAIFPYLGGAELNSSPTHSHHRFVISFGEMSETEARRWPDLMEIVEAKVKPERLKDKRDSRKNRWWRFGEVAPALARAVSGHSRVLALCRVSPQFSVTFLPSDLVFDISLIVFPFETPNAFCVLQSGIHEIWARFFGSSLKDDLRYAPSDCFETFPFPPDWESNAALEEAGKTYYEFRAALMIRNDEGLTKTYNRFHDPEERSPDILRLRELHAAMDRAVLDAYGWTDLPTACQFLLDYEEDDEADPETTGKKGKKKKKPWRYRWPDDIRDEVLARLLALNAERHQEEVRLGIAPGMKAKKTASGEKKRRATQRQKNNDEML